MHTKSVASLHQEQPQVWQAYTNHFWAKNTYEKVMNTYEKVMNTYETLMKMVKKPLNTYEHL